MIGLALAAEVCAAQAVDSALAQAARELAGRRDVDLQIEHIFFPGGYAKLMRIPGGFRVGQHRHKQGHDSIYSGGPVVVRSEFNGDHHLPQGAGDIFMPADELHEINALGDVLWLCVWKTDETDPAKIDEAVIQGEEACPSPT